MMEVAVVLAVEHQSAFEAHGPLLEMIEEELELTWFHVKLLVCADS